MNNLELFNELNLLLCLYMLPCFTEWVTSAAVQYSYGWVFVYMIGPLFMINIGYVIMLAIEMCTKKCKKMAFDKK